MSKRFFDFVIGNPPYQEMSELNSRQEPVYHKFMDAVYPISDCVELITPARFLFDAGQTPKEWNRKMLHDEHLKILEYVSDPKSVFSNVEIKGGVAISLRNQNKKLGPIKVFTKHPQMNLIVNKVFQQHDDDDFLSKIVAPRGNYRFTDAFFEENPKAKEVLGKGTANMIASNAVNNLSTIFRDKPLDETYIRLLGREGNARVYKWLPRKYVIINEYLDYFNVAIPEANGMGTFGEVLSSPIILKPNEGATDTFISIGFFASKEEVEALLKYIKTKFARALLSIKKATQHTSKNVWTCVPLQDFSADSDINWSLSVHGIDLQLYRKYGLDQAEIDFIEKNVKEMA